MAQLARTVHIARTRGRTRCEGCAALAKLLHFVLERRDALQVRLHDAHLLLLRRGVHNDGAPCLAALRTAALRGEILAAEAPSIALFRYHAQLRRCGVQLVDELQRLGALARARPRASARAALAIAAAVCSVALALVDEQNLEGLDLALQRAERRSALRFVKDVRGSESNCEHDSRNM